MNQVKIKEIGWVELDTRTDGFYYGTLKVIDCSGKILSYIVEDYQIFD